MANTMRPIRLGRLVVFAAAGEQTYVVQEIGTPGFTRDKEATS